MKKKIHGGGGWARHVPLAPLDPSTENEENLVEIGISARSKFYYVDALRKIIIVGPKFNYFFPQSQCFFVFFKLTIIFLIRFSDNKTSTAAGNLTDRISDALTQQHRFTEGIKIL